MPPRANEHVEGRLAERHKLAMMTGRRPAISATLECLTRSKANQAKVNMVLETPILPFSEWLGPERPI